MRPSIAVLVCCAVASIVWPTVALGQGKRPAEIDKRAQRLVAEIQKQRAQEREALHAATQAMLADARVKGNAQRTQAIQNLERAIFATRDRADREMPGEVAGLYKLKASGRPAPPIPGKSGNLTAEMKINEHYNREAADQNRVIQQTNIKELQDMLQKYQRDIEDNRRRTQDAIFKMWVSLLTF